MFTRCKHRITLCNEWHGLKDVCFMVISTSSILVCAFITLQKWFLNMTFMVQFYASLCSCLWLAHKKSFLHQPRASRAFNQLSAFKHYSSFCLWAFRLFTITSCNPPRQRQSRVIKQFISSRCLETSTHHLTQVGIKVFVGEWRCWDEDWALKVLKEITWNTADNQ